MNSGRDPSNMGLLFSFRDAALKMKVSRNTISKYIKSQKPYGKYKITLDKD